MSSPLVDIGIPVFRRTEYVGPAIESVIAQSYGHWQLTISEDGGPTEPIMRAVEPYLGDDRIRYVHPDTHLGLARHKASLVARGHARYVAILDDDDCWLPEWLTRRVRFLEQEPECVFVWGGHFDIDADGHEIGRRPLRLAGGVHSSREFFRKMMYANIVMTPSILFRRDAYIRAGNKVDPRFACINDYELWLRLGLLGPVGFLPVYDSGYRVHPANMSSRHDWALDHLHLLDHLDAMLEHNFPDLRLPASVLRRKKADGLLSVALDAAEQGKARAAARQIAAAAQLAPLALASPRGLGAIAAVLSGEKLRRRIGAMRA